MSYCYLHWPEEPLCKLKMMMTFIKVKGQQGSNVINYVLWLPYLVTRTAEAMVKESKVKERSNFTKYRRNVRLCSDLFTDVVSFCICKFAVNFYMINEIWQKRKLLNIAQCPFNRKSTTMMFLEKKQKQKQKTKRNKTYYREQKRTFDILEP